MPSMRRPQGEYGVGVALRVDAQVQPGAQVQALNQGPELGAQLLLERLHQPLGQVVAVALHQIGDLDVLALVQPVLFLVRQRTAQKIAWAVKAQNRQAPLLGTTARWCKVIEQLLLAQHGVDRFSHRGALAWPQATVIPEKS